MRHMVAVFGLGLIFGLAFSGASAEDQSGELNILRERPIRMLSTGSCQMRPFLAVNIKR